MDAEGLRRLMRSSGTDLWSLIDSSIALAAAEHGPELRARRDSIVQRLYASPAPALDLCRGCRRPNKSVRVDEDEDEDEDEEAEEEEEEEEEGRRSLLRKRAASPVMSPEYMNGEEEGGEEDELSKVLAIKELLEDPDQSDDSLVRLLQNLADMDITFKSLKETDIGRHVNGFRKHPSGEVRRLVKLLVRKWKDLVDDWVKSNSGAASPAIITDGDSPPQQIAGKGHQVPEFGHSPNPQNSYLSSERNGLESIEPKAKAAIAAAPPPPRKEAPAKPVVNNNYHRHSNHGSHSTPTSATPTNGKGPKDGLMDPERLASARRRLHENYQEAQNAKKQRTIQVMDIHEIPKRKNSAPRRGGFQAKHW